ncbi:hypothetical protein [Pedobacter metabolipauper]|uniref:Lipoprotein n=1 Tax=Pedobacter metabolipauper TaxID=425513 RepID=A0A4R6STY4_9SPHI|nr:hypothetical protein [Pedobacter metabolipauper]TDQ09218.1 hypothetical protein ATK78_1372 [Pedobacter metabolipauper]
MKRILLLAFSTVLLFSCKKDESSFTKTITRGEKWGIRIGSSPAEVFAQLQRIGPEKSFNEVGIVYRKPFSKPEDVANLLAYYHAITVITNTGRVDRAVIVFRSDKVTYISAGGALPAEVAKWPQDLPDEIAIHKDDPVNEIYDKLLAIYQMPAYSGYELVLPDKTLSKAYDPDMANYTEWAFSFSEVVDNGMGGLSSVRLFFKNGKLSSIKHMYNEAPLVYD